MNTVNFYQELGNEIIKNDEFISEYQNLQSTVGFPNHELEDNVYKRLIESASILACSDDEDHKNIALGIAGTIMEHEKTNELIKASAELIFLRLGDFPALTMSIDKYGDYFNVLNGGKLKKLPINLNVEIVNKILSNQFQIGDKRTFLIDFQIKVLKLLRKKKNISISAPTSAGKSYILTRYLVEVLQNIDEFVTVYIVPTRALISQVQREFRNVLKEYGVKNVDIFTTSWEIVGEGQKQYSKAIMILTQERLQAIEGKVDQLHVDLLIVDEAQKIEEGARGILLEESVQQLIDWNPDSQLVFISPFTENPEKLGSVFVCEEVTPIETTFSPVSQKLIDVDIGEEDINISLLSQELKKELKISKLPIEKKIPKTYKRKAWVATNIVKGGSTMVYCDGPADCRRTAGAIANYSVKKEVEPRVNEVIKYLQKHIHRSYFLIDYLDKGIGYHYGNMPPSVRAAMESLFSNKLINTICCTSTLMEGVNFPARNIVIYNPKTGKPMEKLSFWNLAGRAGRLTKDFCGNVYCVNINDWKGYKPGIERESHKIRSSMEDVISKKKELLIKHLRQYERIKIKENEDVEAAVTRFIINEVQRGNKEFVGQLLERDSTIKEEDLNHIVAIVKEIVKDIEVPADIILENRSIDPRLQNNLYRYLTSIKGIPPIPLHPSEKAFYNSLRSILGVIDISLNKNQHPKYLNLISFITTSWCNENTLGEIIRGRLSYKENSISRELTKKEINDEIEDIIKLINGTITYEVCRDVSCYISVLKSALRKKNIDIKIDEKLGYYIEIGANKPTTLTLLNNGIPRTEAILLSRRMPLDIQDFKICLEYIKLNQNELRKEIPSIMLEEFFS